MGGTMKAAHSSEPILYEACCQGCDFHVMCETEKGIYRAARRHVREHDHSHEVRVWGTDRRGGLYLRPTVVKAPPRD